METQRVRCASRGGAIAESYRKCPSSASQALPGSVVYVTVPCTPLSYWAAECGTGAREQGQQYPGVPPGHSLRVSAWSVESTITSTVFATAFALALSAPGQSEPAAGQPVKGQRLRSRALLCALRAHQHSSSRGYTVPLPTPPVLQCAQRPPGNRHSGQAYRRHSLTLCCPRFLPGSFHFFLSLFPS